MDTGRNAHVVAAHVEGLRELQTLRAAMEDDDQPFDRQFSTVFDAAVDFSLAAIPLRALLLTTTSWPWPIAGSRQRPGWDPRCPCSRWRTGSNGNAVADASTRRSTPGRQP